MNEHVPFSLHRTFAANLRDLCARHQSIAFVCRALGMNRQQFNKYLAGSSLPNAATLEKISAFFGVTPERLFHAAPGAGAAAAMPPAELPSLALFGKLPLDALLLAAGPLEKMRRSKLTPGCYHLYAPWPRDPARCERAALYVYRSAGLTFFTRFSKLRLLGQRQRYYPASRHDGVVLESETSRFLLSVNRRGLGDMSLISLGVENASCTDFQTGIALVMDPNASPVALRTTLVYRGDASSLRRTISEAGLLPLSDLGIPEEARRSLCEAQQPHAAHLPAFSLLDGLHRALNRNGGTRARQSIST